jgi:hypothetical protein
MYKIFFKVGLPTELQLIRSAVRSWRTLQAVIGGDRDENHLLTRNCAEEERGGPLGIKCCQIFTYCYIFILS